MASRDMLALGTLYPAPGFCSEVQHIFVARGLYPSKATPDDDEAITLVPLSVEEAEEAARTGRLSDAKSLALILRARLNGLI